MAEIDAKVAEMFSAGYEDKAEEVEVPEVKAAAPSARAKKNDILRMADEAFQKAMSENSSILEQVKELSDFISVEKVLVYSDRGNIKNKKDREGVKVMKQSAKDPTKQVPDYEVTPTTVGYRFKNNSDVTLKVYKTFYTPDGVDEDGKKKYTSERKEVDFEPGAVIDLSRVDAGIFALDPRISGQFANAKMVMKIDYKLLQSVREHTDSARGIVQKWNIRFTDGETSVNDALVREQIGEKIGETEDGKTEWAILPEYEPGFGGDPALDVDAPKGKGKGKAKKAGRKASKAESNVDPQVKLAVLVKSLMDSEGA